MSQNTVISGPVPPYSNPPIQPQFFQPSRFVISALTLGQTTTITTSVDHNYVIGQQVRLLIPSKHGSTSLNEQSGIVLSIPASNQVILDINSNGADPFIATPTFMPFQQQTPSQIIAIGDYNTGLISMSGRSLPTTTIPGSFINISPL